MGRLGKWMRCAMAAGVSLVLAAGAAGMQEGARPAGSAGAGDADKSGRAANTAMATVAIDYRNDKLAPPHWVLTVHEDGTGEFFAERGDQMEAAPNQVVLGEIRRPIQVRPSYVAEVLATARSRRRFDFQCESHLKVAFQGAKTLSYQGPDGSGSCEYNYSKDKEINELGESLMAVANTLLFGAKMEKLLQHDRLGLDAMTEDLVNAVHDGNAREMEVIRDTLEKIANDDEVLDRARKRARLLLAQAK